MAGIPIDSPVTEAPWRAGLRAARAHLVPGLVLQAIALALVLAYYWYPPARAAFEQLMVLRQRTGLLFSIVATAFCGGVVPFFYMRSHPDTRGRYTWLSGLFFTGFWAYKGIEVEFWYRFLAWGVGNDSHVRTVVIKVLVDQLIYCPVWAVVVTVIAYAWQAAGFNWGPVLADFRAGHW